MKLIEKIKNNKRKSVMLLTALLLVVLTVVLLLWKRPLLNKPTLIIETPQKISVSNKEIFNLDLSISDLEEARYPAASFSIDFDSSRLEFLNVEEGNMFIHDSDKENGIGQDLPDWNFNVEESNKSGKINIMYLDLTGGKYAFSKDLLEPDDNVVLRLSFRLRGSARIGDVYELSIEDAVFAASDSTQSLAMTQNTLKTKNGKIVIGE